MCGTRTGFKLFLEPKPEFGVFIKVKNRSTLVGYSVPSGKKDRCPPRPCPSGIKGTLVGYLLPSGKKKNLRPMSAMPPSLSPFWDKGGKKKRLPKKKRGSQKEMKIKNKNPIPHFAGTCAILSLLPGLHALSFHSHTHTDMIQCFSPNFGPNSPDFKGKKIPNRHIFIISSSKKTNKYRRIFL